MLDLLKVVFIICKVTNFPGLEKVKEKILDYSLLLKNSWRIIEFLTFITVL